MPDEFLQVYHPYPNLEATRTMKHRHKYPEAARPKGRSNRARLFSHLRAGLRSLLSKLNGQNGTQGDLARMASDLTTAGPGVQGTERDGTYAPGAPLSVAGTPVFDPNTTSTSQAEPTCATA